MESLLAAAIVVMVAIAGTLLLHQRARLARSRQILHATLDSVAQGIVMLDPTGRIVVLNRQAAALLQQGAPTRPIAIGDPLPPTVLPDDTGEIRTQAGSCLDVRRTTLPDGSSVWTYTDVTDIRANAAALAAARDAAERASQARADFLAVMSHEVRTPLNGIIGVAGLLLDGDPAATGQNLRSYAKLILQSGEHLLQLVTDILDFSRIDAGRLELEETAFDIRAVTRSAVELFASEARRKALTLTIDFADDVPVRAGGDPGRLRQVLLNLVGNALKFTEHGGVSLRVRRLGAEPRGLRLGFSVADTGIGMSEQGLGRLFGEFVQGDSSISRRFGGSGLGLAICKGLVERMGGQIRAESRPGEGSVFHFDVLLRARRASDTAPADDTRPAEPAALPAAPPPRLRVLVAEDNATNRLVVGRLLERQGHSVVEATNGREALAALAHTQCDLVLMDVMMPEMDGLAATAEIRRMAPPLSRIPIIGLTANAMPSEEEACRAAGMNGFATKPITAARLAEVIAQAINAQPPHEPPAPQALPVIGENRSFDPAVLDLLARTSGAAQAEAAVAGFIAAAPETINALRLLQPDDPTARWNTAKRLAGHAAQFGLMRAARAGLDLEADAPADAYVHFTRLLSHGLEELRAWRRSR